MRRQMRDRALAGLDKLEVLQRSALSGAPILSVAQSVAQSVAGDLPPAPSEAGGAPGAEEEFHYQPTKVCAAGLFLLLSNGSWPITAGSWVSGPTRVRLASPWVMCLYHHQRFYLTVHSAGLFCRTVMNALISLNAFIPLNPLMPSPPQRPHPSHLSTPSPSSMPSTPSPPPQRPQSPSIPSFTSTPSNPQRA